MVKILRVRDITWQHDSRQYNRKTIKAYIEEQKEESKREEKIVASYRGESAKVLEMSAF